MIFSILKRILRTLYSIKSCILGPRQIVYLIISILRTWIRIVYSFLSLTLISGIVLGGSIFLYLTFYMTYVPNLSHTWPVHLQFKSCEKSPGLCSEPYALVTLKEEKTSGYIFGHKQEYQIFIDLEMPDSPVNQKLGMFSINLLVFSQEACNLGSQEDCEASRAQALSTRYAMMEYKSFIQRTISSVVMYPLYVLGFKNDHQIISVEMFSELENDNSNAFYKANVFLNTRYIEVYKCQLRWVAKFSGLRYWMYYHPFISTLAGIIIFMTFLSFFPLISLLPFSSMNESKVHTKGTKDKLVKSDLGKVEDIPPDNIGQSNSDEKEKSLQYKTEPIRKKDTTEKKQVGFVTEEPELLLKRNHFVSQASQELNSDDESVSPDSNSWDECISDTDNTNSDVK